MVPSSYYFSKMGPKPKTTSLIIQDPLFLYLSKPKTSHLELRALWEAVDLSKPLRVGMLGHNIPTPETLHPQTRIPKNLAL